MGTKGFLLDGKPVDMQELIEAAKALGYDTADWLYRTSEAAEVLREHGHAVQVIDPADAQPD